MILQYLTCKIYNKTWYFGRCESWNKDSSRLTIQNLPGLVRRDWKLRFHHQRPCRTRRSFLYPQGALWCKKRLACETQGQGKNIQAKQNHRLWQDQIEFFSHYYFTLPLKSWKITRDTTEASAGSWSHGLDPGYLGIILRMGKAKNRSIGDSWVPLENGHRLEVNFPYFPSPLVAGELRQDPFIACSTLAGAGGSSIFRVPELGERCKAIKTRGQVCSRLPYLEDTCPQIAATLRLKAGYTGFDP